MQKKIVLAGMASLLMMTASAQGGEDVPAPPPPPKPPAAKMKNVPPPPPPPEAPIPPDAPPKPKEFDAFMKRNPNITAVEWHNERFIVRLKSGAEETYNLADEASRKKAIAKYGELPSEPPPPPAPPPPPKPRSKRSISL